MSEIRELSADIIDVICEQIEKEYDIEPKILDEGDDIENPALLNGEVYYILESYISNKIIDHVLSFINDAFVGDYDG